MKISVIIIAHNDLELLKSEIRAILLNACDEISNLVIVDNASTDGTAEWLQEENWDYIVFDEGIQGYSFIINTVIKEFEITDDVLIISPNNIIISDAIQEMHKLLYKKENILAVSPGKIVNGTVANYGEAIELTKQTNGSKDIRRIGLPSGAVMFKKHLIDELGFFDENIKLPESAVTDMLFRGVLRGYELYESGSSFVYKLGYFEEKYSDAFGTDADRKVLKSKWNMNYFGTASNYTLVSCIKENKEKEINVLEVGCDCGANLLEVKKLYPNAHIYGLELNEQSAQIASCVAQVQNGNIEDENVDFVDVKFDYIMFGDVLEHLHDPEGTIRYCREILKPGGKIISCIPNLMHYSVVQNLINGKFTYTDMGLLDRTHIHFFTYDEIMYMFKNVGYDVENIASIDTKKFATKTELEFVNKLMDITDEAQEFMFYTFQYIVVAKMI